MTRSRYDLEYNFKCGGWSWREILAALKSNGHTLTSLAKSTGRSRTHVTGSKDNYNRLIDYSIADAVNVHPHIIWPTKYNFVGAPYDSAHRNPTQEYMHVINNQVWEQSKLRQMRVDKLPEKFQPPEPDSIDRRNETRGREHVNTYRHWWGNRFMLLCAKNTQDARIYCNDYVEPYKGDMEVYNSETSRYEVAL